MKRPYAAARALAVSALILAGQSAAAVEMHGYFRDSEGFNTKGGSQVCFQLPGSDFKARLGNECDRYLEMNFSQTGKIGSWEWKAQFMPASYLFSGDSSGGNNLFIQEMWTSLKNLDWGGPTLWAGRRYFKRHDVHSLDWFYWNPAQGNVGFGVEDVDLHFGKLALTTLRIDATSSKAANNLIAGSYLVPEVRIYDIPLYPGGTLEAGVDLGIAIDWAESLGKGRAMLNPLATIQHNQANLLGGSNTLALQFGSGAFAKESGDGPGQLIAGAKSSTQQWRIIEHLVLNPNPLFSGAVVVVYQDKSQENDGGSRTFTGELRPAVHFNDWFKVQADVFFQTMSFKNSVSGTGSPNLLKVTLAPTLVVGREYFTRPELRLFVTYAHWNQDANLNGGVTSGGFYGSAHDGVTVGAHVESWF